MLRQLSISLRAARPVQTTSLASAANLCPNHSRGSSQLPLSATSVRSSISLMMAHSRFMSSGSRCCNDPNHHHVHYKHPNTDSHKGFATVKPSVPSTADFTTRTTEVDTTITGGPPYSTLNHGDEYTRLFTNNRKWVEEKTANDPNYFKRLAEGQKPHYLLIGCSDSRAPPDQLTKTQPGEIFIHRNVANMVIHTDMNLMTVLQYAVENLLVKHVIVMGHYQCGGVKASMSNDAHGLIDKWLRNIKDVYRLHRVELDAIKDEKKRFDRLVELNVVEQVMNLYKTNIIQSAWARGQPVRVHGWVYDVGTGLVRDLEVERRSDWGDLKSIYEIKFPDQ